MRLILAAVLVAGAGCAQLMPPAKQEPFPLIEVKATRPPPGPDRVVLTASNVAIMDKVQFETGKADIKSESHSLLDEVAKVLKDNPQVELISVEGHTDSTGSPDFNRKLSQQRAESVAKYLSTKGVKAARMEPKGFGPDHPIADNESDAGREANRRVEFNILKQGPKKVLVKDE
ncbi:MAG TPA: OmpA family protein [Kofleriaceae bacterium]|nr:OmpA family protein [Kofleriaceae bacterium]